MWIAIIVMVILLVPIVWRWVVGMDYMDENHPDYKGKDLFDEDDDTNHKEIE